MHAAAAGTASFIPRRRRSAGPSQRHLNAGSHGRDQRLRASSRGTGQRHCHARRRRQRRRGGRGRHPSRRSQRRTAAGLRESTASPPQRSADFGPPDSAALSDVAIGVPRDSAAMAGPRRPDRPGARASRRARRFQGPSARRRLGGERPSVEHHSDRLLVRGMRSGRGDRACCRRLRRTRRPTRRRRRPRHVMELLHRRLEVGVHHEVQASASARRMSSRLAKSRWRELQLAPFRRQSKIQRTRR